MSGKNFFGGFVVRVQPSRDHPIYVEWRKWRKKCETNYSAVAQEAKDSIEKIAEFIYKDHGTIVGAMIMMDDIQTEEEEGLICESCHSEKGEERKDLEFCESCSEEARKDREFDEKKGLGYL